MKNTSGFNTWTTSRLTVYFLLLPLLILLSARTCLVAGTSLRFTTMANELRIRDGDRASVDCVATGMVHVNDEFIWSGPTVNSSRTTITESSSGITSTLVITNFQESDAGLYSCSFTGSSDVISITMTYAGRDATFLDVPLIQQVEEGTDAVIVCPFSPMNDDVFTFWSKEDGTPIPNPDNRLTFTPSNGEMRIQSVRMEDAEINYKCSLFDDNSNDDGLPDSRTITIEVLPRSAFAPSINDTNRRIEVVHGEPLDLPCLLEEPKDNVVYSWTINTEFEHDHIVDTRATLHRDSSKFLGGAYTCRAENKFGYVLAEFTVKIIAPPLPTICSLVRKTPELGTTVVLKYCDMTSPVDLSDLRFQWGKVDSNDEAVNVQLGDKFSINYNGWLTIKNIEADDLGEYRVTVSNEMGTAVHNVQLKLESPGVIAQPAPLPQAPTLSQHAPPLPALCSRDTEDREEGYPVMLQYCDFTSPVQLVDLVFRWSKDGFEIVLGMKYSVTNGFLFINNTTTLDAGLYQVTISNSWGAALHSVRLNIHPKELFVPTSNPPSPILPRNCSKTLENIDEGSSVLLRYCDFTTPVELTNLTFQWRKGGEEIDIMADQGEKYEISNEGYLTINNVQESDSGIYHVEIQNKWGSALHQVQLTITPRVLFITPTQSPGLDSGLTASVIMFALVTVLLLIAASIFIACICIKRRKRKSNSPTYYDNPDTIVAVRFRAAPSLPLRACNRNTGRSIPDEKHAYDDPDIDHEPNVQRPRGSKQDDCLPEIILSRSTAQQHATAEDPPVQIHAEVLPSCGEPFLTQREQETRINNDGCESDILNKIEADNVGLVTSQKGKKLEQVQTNVPTYDRVQAYERAQTYQWVQTYERIQPYERAQTYERRHTQYNLEDLLA